MPLLTRVFNMKCTVRVLGLVALAFGLVSNGALSLAVVTDYWLYASEPMNPDTLFPPGELPPDFPPMLIKTHSGLWRNCIMYDSSLFPENETENIPRTSCNNIGYLGQEYARVEDGDTTNSILRAIRRASPVIVISLFIQLAALALSTIGNSKGDNKTLIGAVLFIFSALTLAIGVIFYISAVNDEVAHRKKPESKHDTTFEYCYGWAFFFAGSSFLSSMMAAVANITLYLKRYSKLEDMVMIIPGLSKSVSKVSSEDELDSIYHRGAQNPTIIL